MPRRSWFRKLQMRNLTFGRRNNHVKVNLIHVKPCNDDTATQQPDVIPASNFRKAMGKYFPFLLPKNKVVPITDGGGDDKNTKSTEQSNQQAGASEKRKLNNIAAMEKLSKMLPATERYDPSSITQVIDPDSKTPMIIGRGSFGVVELVGTGDRRLLALKRVPCKTDADRRRIYLEARVMSLLQPYPYFPTNFGVYDDIGSVSILMEFVNLYHSLEKLTLDDLCYVNHQVSISPIQCIQILEKVAKAVQIMHLRGILHNDLASRNIMLYHSFSGNFEVKIVDFGLVCPIETPVLRCSKPVFDDEVEKQKFLFDHPEFAPELLEAKPHTVETDIYSLGSIIKDVSNFCGGLPCLEKLANQCRHKIPEARQTIEIILYRLQTIKKNKEFLTRGQ